MPETAARRLDAAPERDASQAARIAQLHLARRAAARRAGRLPLRGRRAMQGVALLVAGLFAALIWIAKSEIFDV